MQDTPAQPGRRPLICSLCTREHPRTMFANVRCSAQCSPVLAIQPYPRSGGDYCSSAVCSPCARAALTREPPRTAQLCRRLNLHFTKQSYDGDAYGHIAEAPGKTRYGSLCSLARARAASVAAHSLLKANPWARDRYVGGDCPFGRSVARWHSGPSRSHTWTAANFPKAQLARATAP